MKRKSTLNKIIKNRAEGLAPMQRSKVNSITPKTRAKASAPYMRSELEKLNKRQNRLGGR